MQYAWLFSLMSELPRMHIMCAQKLHSPLWFWERALFCCMPTVFPVADIQVAMYTCACLHIWCSGRKMHRLRKRTTRTICSHIYTCNEMRYLLVFLSLRILCLYFDAQIACPGGVSYDC